MQYPTHQVTVETWPKPLSIPERYVTTEQSLLAKVLRPAKTPYLAADRPLQAHETTHLVQAEFRVAHSLVHRRPILAFWDGHQIKTVDDPGVKRDAVIRQIPETLRGHRFTLYFEQASTDWEGNAANILDEFSAYLCQLRVADDDFKHARDVPAHDHAGAVAEFSIYLLAYCKAFEEADPDGWARSEAFRGVVVCWLAEARRLYLAHHQRWNHAETPGLVDRLRHSSEAAGLRSWIVTRGIGSEWLAPGVRP